MPGWTVRAQPRLRAFLPFLPAGVLRRLETTRTETYLAIALVGTVVAAAAAAGARSHGRSEVYQQVLMGFGLHGLGHLAQAAVFRGYTPGVVTAVGIVIPYSSWAWRRLRVAGVARGAASPSPTFALTFVGVVGGAHLTARTVARRLRPYPTRRPVS